MQDRVVSLSLSLSLCTGVPDVDILKPFPSSFFYLLHVVCSPALSEKLKILIARRQEIHHNSTTHVNDTGAKSFLHRQPTK